MLPVPQFQEGRRFLYTPNSTSLHSLSEASHRPALPFFPHDIFSFLDCHLVPLLSTHAPSFPAPLPATYILYIPRMLTEGGVNEEGGREGDRDLGKTEGREECNGGI